MKRSQRTGLIFGGAVLFLATGPAEAQVWVRPTPPLMIAPAPVVVAPTPRVVVPAPVVVSSGWRGRPYRSWASRRYRPYRRRYWYAPAWGPPARVVPVYRRW